jgi:hypothetical protein
MIKIAFGCLLICGLVVLLLGLNYSGYAQFLNASHLAVNVRQVESVFDNGGNPWPWLSQTNAIDYDNGGKNIAFNVPVIGVSPCSPVPPAGQAYRPDFININIIADLGQTLGVGCNQVGNWMNYTTRNSSAGPFTLSLRAALGDAGSASWDVYIDGGLVNGVHGTIVVQNTGSIPRFKHLPLPALMFHKPIIL